MSASAAPELERRQGKGIIHGPHSKEEAQDQGQDKSQGKIENVDAKEIGEENRWRKAAADKDQAESGQDDREENCRENCKKEAGAESDRRA